MLSQADLDIIARDPDLPGLPLLLDPEAVAERLGGRAVPLHLRYKPGQSCLATFETAQGILMLRAVTVRRFAKMIRHGRWPAGAGLWPDMAVAVLEPRHDRRIISPQVGYGTLLRFKPERRLVRRTQKGTLKALTRQSYERAAKGAAFGAQVIRSDPALGLLETAWLEGTPADRISDAATHRAIGARLAELHATASDLPALAPLAPPAALRDLARLLPGLALRLARIGARLKLALALVPPAQASCHGDFSADQVVVGDGIAFIDWDQAGRGEPARDIGCYLARLDREGQAALAGPFLAGYGDLPEGVAACHAAALAALATEPFRQRQTDWAAASIALLDRIEAVLPDTDLLDFACRADAVARLHPGITAAELIRLKPGRRAVIRYDADRPMIGKLRFKGADHQTPDLQQQMHAAGLPVPRVLGTCPEAHLWFQELIPGSSLTTLLYPGGPIGPFAATGAALAQLHNAHIPAMREWTMAQECAVLQNALAALPDTTGLVRALCDRVLSLPEAVPCGIHRDFYPDQVIVADRAYLLDLDLYAQGDPAIDIANFLAHLDEMAFRLRLPPECFDAQAEAFLSGYEAARPLPAPMRIAALRAVSLARHMAISQRFDERRHEAPLILRHLSQPEFLRG